MEAETDFTDPLNPAFYAGGPVLVPGDELDLTADNGGLAEMMPVVGDSDWRPGDTW